MSDVLQREDGHVFRDSGDNYLFMVESRFKPNITPGTALSRSRFEDATFSLGENLKQGIRTGFGTVTVQKHTELELVFTDPATGQLHPGVRETIHHGHNLYVKYPGYADYRHVPVIGKGITFTVPGSLDQWGMMCEADLEEVYRRRSLGYQAGKRALLACFVTGGSGLLLDRIGVTDVSSAVLAATMGWAAAAAVFSSTVPFGKRIDLQSRFLLAMAECGASLRERLKWDSLSNDEIGNLGRWINSFVDKMDQTVGSSLNVAEQVQAASARLHRIATEVASGSDQQLDVAKLSSDAIEALDANSGAVARQSQAAKCIAEEASTASARGAEVVQQAIQEMGFTSQVINDLAIRIDTLNHRSDEINTILVVIKAIADQTNLLALNAAIEAARAGEHGRGFSVVADEVRSLAQRTVQSTGEITTMIDSIQSDTKAAVTMMDQCRAQVDRGASLITDAGAALGQINEGADQAAQGISAIAEATVEQAAISQSIAEQVRSITRFANHSSAKAQEALTAVRDLEQLSRDLTGTVSKFSL